MDLILDTILKKGLFSWHHTLSIFQEMSCLTPFFFASDSSYLQSAFTAWAIEPIPLPSVGLSQFRLWRAFGSWRQVRNVDFLAFFDPFSGHQILTTWKCKQFYSQLFVYMGQRSCDPLGKQTADPLSLGALKLLWRSWHVVSCLFTVFLT